MKTLSYGAAIELYVAHHDKDGDVYYDLSEDIVSCSVTRMMESPSGFNATFLNPNGKYNNLFEPMDRVTIFATKGNSRQQLFTGYITQVTRFQLYNGDFQMSGKDTLYRLEKTYFDPGLVYYSGLFAQSFNGSENWGGYAADIVRWLVKVGDWPVDQIGLKDIPTSVLDWAKSIYMAQREDIEGLQNIEQEFYNVLKSSGGVLGTGDSSVPGVNGEVLSGDAGKVVNLYLSWLGKFTYKQTRPGGLTPWSSGVTDCSGSICAAYKQALGITVGTFTGDMDKYGQMIDKGSGNVDISKMKPGDAILMNYNNVPPSPNSAWAHVVLYIGNDQLAHMTYGTGPTRISEPASQYFGARGRNWEIRRYVQ